MKLQIFLEIVCVQKRNISEYPKQAFPIQLDLTDTESIHNAVNKTMEHFGSIDILVNNAGYCYRSSVEESDDSEVMRMFQTNLFGLIDLTKEVLPFMREKNSDTIVNFSSVAALSANPASAFYASSKAAVELLSDGLRKEVSPLGIRVIVVEPGAFRTNFFSTSLRGTQMKIADYQDTAWKRYPENAIDTGDQQGDPDKAANVLLKAIQSDNPPFRLLLSKQAVDFARQEYKNRLVEIDKWQNLSETTDFD